MPEPADQSFERVAEALRGRYRIEREVGHGGMATVYLAEDLKHHRRVAVKVLRPELAAALGPERFLREIEIAARLHHPHILPLYDSGDAGGVVYYVMPFVEGESLRDGSRGKSSCRWTVRCGSLAKSPTPSPRRTVTAWCTATRAHEPYNQPRPPSSTRSTLCRHPVATVAPPGSWSDPTRP